MDTSLLVKVARLYYEDNRTQQEIAQELGLTRLKVNYVLKRAKSEGIVQIKVVDPQGDFTPLENAIIKRFGLKKVIIIPEIVSRKNLLRHNLGKAASAYLNEVLKRGDVLGVGWGATVLETVSSLSGVEERPITVVPLIGGGSETLDAFDVNKLAHRIADAFAGRYYPLHAPALVDRRETRELLIRDSSIRRVLDLWEKTRLILVGIGGTASRWPETLNNHLGTPRIDLDTYGVVGDIVCRFYDIKGKLQEFEMYERMLGIDLEALRAVETVIGVAGGLTKFEAILGALRGRHINVLVTDEAVGRELVAVRD